MRAELRQNKKKKQDMRKAFDVGAESVLFIFSHIGHATRNEHARTCVRTRNFSADPRLLDTWVSREKICFFKGDEKVPFAKTFSSLLSLEIQRAIRGEIKWYPRQPFRSYQSREGDAESPRLRAIKTYPGSG